jgi:hypothetical protein
MQSVGDGGLFISVNLTKPFPLVPGLFGILELQPEIASESS